MFGLKGIYCEFTAGYSGILKNTLNLLYSVKRLLISVDQTMSSCDVGSWFYPIRGYLRLALIGIGQHRLSLIVDSVWSGCSVTVVGIFLVKCVCFSRENSNLFSYWLYGYFLLGLLIVQIIPGNYLSFYFRLFLVDFRVMFYAEFTISELLL